MESPRKALSHRETIGQFPIEVQKGFESNEIGFSITNYIIDNVGDHIRDQRLNDLIKPIATAAAMKNQLFVIGLRCLKADPCIDDAMIEEEQAPIPPKDPRCYK